MSPPKTRRLLATPARVYSMTPKIGKRFSASGVVSAMTIQIEETRGLAVLANQMRLERNEAP